MTTHLPFQRTRAAHCIASAFCLLTQAWAASAQTTNGATGQTGDSPTLPTINIRANQNSPDVTGFGDLPQRQVPTSTTVIDSATLQRNGARGVADLTRFDASISDAYNSAGYFDNLTVRGFVIENRRSYRRDGLPLIGETFNAFDNKERIEVLKGTSGLQAGVSAPGGLVNFVVKRPPPNGNAPVRQARLGVGENGSALVAVDLGGRAGMGANPDGFGYRLNLAGETLRPALRNANGQRSLIGLATDWRLSRDTLVEAEIEQSRRSQPSQPGFSLLGSRLPAPTDPRINLNNQSWSQPVVFDNTVGSLRATHAFNAQWNASLAWGFQRTRTDDRVAFPFGCTATNQFDRFCPDGTFDLYDFRSEGERRQRSSWLARLNGQFELGGTQHRLTVSLLQTQLRERFNAQAYNLAGTGNVQGTVQVAASPALGNTNTNNDERSTELSVADAITIGAATLFVGARHTQLARSSVLTNGTEPAVFRQSFTTPWLGISLPVSPGLTGYASWGQGVESNFAPNRPGTFANAGRALPALRSRQLELGLRWESLQLAGQAFSGQVNMFQIVQPAVSDVNVAGGLQVRQTDGVVRNQGLEGLLATQVGAWDLSASFMLLNARREGSVANLAANGKAPPNVPDHAVRLNALYRVAGVPGLSLDANLSHEGGRNVLQDGSVRLPAWTVLNLGATFAQRQGNQQWTWRLALDNALDRRYWRESPFQFSHAYLFPGAPRTLRLGLSVSL